MLSLFFYNKIMDTELNAVILDNFQGEIRKRGITNFQDAVNNVITRTLTIGKGSFIVNIYLSKNNDDTWYTLFTFNRFTTQGIPKNPNGKDPVSFTNTPNRLVQALISNENNGSAIWKIYMENFALFDNQGNFKGQFFKEFDSGESAKYNNEEIIKLINDVDNSITFLNSPEAELFDIQGLANTELDKWQDIIGKPNGNRLKITRSFAGYQTAFGGKLVENIIKYAVPIPGNIQWFFPNVPTQEITKYYSGELIKQGKNAGQTTWTKIQETSRTLTPAERNSFIKKSISRTIKINVENYVGLGGLRRAQQFAAAPKKTIKTKGNKKAARKIVPRSTGGSGRAGSATRAIIRRPVRKVLSVYVFSNIGTDNKDK